MTAEFQRFRSLTGAEVARFRERHGLTQAGLARALGLKGENSRRTIRRWEDGETGVPGPTALLLRYVDAYGWPEQALNATGFCMAPDRVTRDEA